MFAVGDKVFLKSGGPAMVVHAVADDGTVTATWHDGGGWQATDFAPAELTRSLLADPRTLDEIEGWFTYHAPTGTQVAKMVLINDAARALALAIAENCPASADRSAAFRLVREARMTANAAIVIPPLPR